MLKVVVNTGDLSDKLDSLPEVVKEALRAEADDIVGMLLADVLGRFSSVFAPLDGKYRASFQTSVKVNPKSVVGKVFSKEEYAGVDEWGGHLPAHFIKPKTARALAFLGTSGEVFSGLVYNPGANIKPHPLWHDVYLQEKDNIVARLVTAGAKSASGTLDSSLSGGG